MRQDFRTGEVDLITAGELSHELHKHLGTQFSKLLRERFAGIKPFKIPIQVVQATATTVNLFNAPPANPAGPESGYFWVVYRVNVTSSVLADTAKFALYSGSDNSINQKQLVDNGNGGLVCNQAYYPGNKGLWIWPDEFLFAELTGATVGNTYILGGIAIEVPAEMIGKLFSG